MKPKPIMAGNRSSWRSLNAAPNEITFPARALFCTGGSGAEVVVGGVRAGITFPNQASYSDGIGAINLPPNWASKVITAELLWIPSSAAAGDVVWTVYLYELYDNSGVSPSYDSEEITDPTHSSATNICVATFTLSAPAAIAEGEFLGFILRRRTDLAEDTYAADVYAMALKFRVR